MKDPETAASSQNSGNLQQLKPTTGCIGGFSGKHASLDVALTIWFSDSDSRETVVALSQPRGKNYTDTGIRL